jgi:glycosyltransferase involved in cell wall biosynthesis
VSVVHLPGPRLAIVIPIFRHSVLVAEAVCSALAQEAPFGIHVVLVNDGCSFPETHEVCTDFALAYPDRVTYLRKPNGGLSDARNHGIRHVLAHMPSVDAVYMLDADNRLRAGALARMMAALDAHPEAAWIYPDIDMFGLRSHWDFGGPYSLLIQTAMNVCEAGSLIRRAVFERGVLYDTSFKLGWEDWDFYLTAAEAGFRGRNEEFCGFHYRKRPESMLADSDRDRGGLVAAMRAKHKALMHPRTLIRLEHEECPRYAILLADRAEVIVATDPAAPNARRLGYDEFVDEFWAALLSPGREACAPYLLVTSSSVFTALSQTGLLHWTLWRLEGAADAKSLAVLLCSEVTQDRIGFTEHAEGNWHRREALVVAITKKLMREIVLDQSSLWIDSLVAEHCTVPMAALELHLPTQIDIAGGIRRRAGLFDFLAVVHQMRDSVFREARHLKPDWRKIGIETRDQTAGILREALRGGRALPRLADGRRHVAFLLPLVEFGGVEKVALQMARGLRAAGLVPHLVVLDSKSAAITAEWRAVFESLSFLVDDEFSTWGWGPDDFFGTNVPRWAQAGPHGAALGLLHGYDAVIGFHGGAIAGLFGQLRRLGIRTVQSLHLNDLTPWGRPVGNTYISLAYEYAVDVFVPCSQGLADWLHAMGVPAAKICPVPNAPGFESEPRAQARGRAERLRRTKADPLRVLYLGRLDRQKGLERLAAVVEKCRARGLNLTWRILGKALIDHDAPTLPAVLEGMIEPPAASAAELTAVYAWADVVVLLSSYEGLPLTVLEAMRAGAVMIATDVGATGEVLRDGENGVLLSLGKAMEGCVESLATLAADREMIASLSAGAIRTSEQRDWLRATSVLAGRLDTAP